MHSVIEMRLVNGKREIIASIRRKVTPAEMKMIHEYGPTYLQLMADRWTELCQNQIEKPERVHLD